MCTLKFLLTNTANFLQSIAKSDTTTTKKKLQIILKHLSHHTIAEEWYYRHYMVYIIQFSLVRNFHFEYKKPKWLVHRELYVTAKDICRNINSYCRFGNRYLKIFLLFRFFLPEILFFCPVQMDSLWKIRKINKSKENVNTRIQRSSVERINDEQTKTMLNLHSFDLN